MRNKTKHNLILIKELDQIIKNINLKNINLKNTIFFTLLLILILNLIFNLQIRIVIFKLIIS